MYLCVAFMLLSETLCFCVVHLPFFTSIHLVICPNVSPTFNLTTSFCPILQIHPEMFPGIFLRMQEKNGMEFDQLQIWLHFGHSPTIFLNLMLLWLYWEHIRSMAWNFCMLMYPDHLQNWSGGEYRHNSDALHWLLSSYISDICIGH